MENKVILNPTIRVIRAITVDKNPGLAVDEVAIDVPFNDVSGGSWKLGLDNVTKVPATADDLRADMESKNPKIIKKRDLLMRLAAVEGSGTLPAVIKEFATALREFLI